MRRTIISAAFFYVQDVRYAVGAGMHRSGDSTLCTITSILVNPKQRCIHILVLCSIRLSLAIKKQPRRAVYVLLLWIT